MNGVRPRRTAVPAICLTCQCQQRRNVATLLMPPPLPPMSKSLWMSKKSVYLASQSLVGNHFLFVSLRVFFGWVARFCSASSGIYIMKCMYYKELRILRMLCIYKWNAPFLLSFITVTLNPISALSMFGVCRVYF